jgi:2-keto-4-pentenoate hydratase/2-oxohepta-3-ene-1,7-dioic acid hydratase in catechol pathway
MFSPRELDLERGWPGKIVGEQVVQLAAQTLQAFFTGGGGAREHAVYELADCDLRPPVLYPPAIRVFPPFARGATPYFSFSSPHPVLGPDQEMRHPDGTEELDYGLAVAAVVGAEGRIGGFTLANVWVAHDLARAEKKAGHGPGKSGDFGISIGPVVVTPDEFEPALLLASVNGEERTAAELDADWDAIVEHASRNTVLRPGDLLVAVAPALAGPPLGPGDVVEVASDAVGTLRNSVV